MKKVLDPQTVAHYWANQIQDEGRNAGHTFYFNGDAIYSYGNHFPIGKHIEYEGKQATLFTTRKYSVTTSSHTSMAHSAANHKNLIFVPDPADTVDNNLEQMYEEMKGILKNIERPMVKKEKYINEAGGIYDRVLKLCEFYNATIPDKIVTLMNSAVAGSYTEWAAKEAEMLKAEAERKKKDAEARHMLTVKDWRAGKMNRMYSRIDTDYLRIKDDKVETSQGVDIPIKIAGRLYKTIVKRMQTGNVKDFEILGYAVTEITKKAITVGCHHIPMTEINRIARKLKLVA